MKLEIKEDITWDEFSLAFLKNNLELVIEDHEAFMLGEIETEEYDEEGLEILKKEDLFEETIYNV